MKRDEDDERRDALVGLGRMRRQRRRQRAPRRRRRGRRSRSCRSTAGPGRSAEDHRELARADDEAGRAARRWNQRPTSAVEQRRDDPAGDRPADDREAAARGLPDARVEDRPGCSAEVRRVEEQRTRAGHRRPRPARRRGRRTGDRRRGRPIVWAPIACQRDPEEDRGRDPERLPATTPSADMGGTGQSRRRSLRSGHGRSVGRRGGSLRRGRPTVPAIPARFVPRSTLAQLADTWRVVLPLTAAVGHATIIRPSVAALGAVTDDMRGGVLEGHPGWSKLRGTSADRRWTSGATGDGAGRQAGVWGTQMTTDTTTGPTLAVRLLGRLEIVACDTARSTRRPPRPGARRAARPPPPSPPPRRDRRRPLARLRRPIGVASLRQALWLVRTGIAAAGVGAGHDPRGRPGHAWPAAGARARRPTSRQFEGLVGDGRQSAGRALASLPRRDSPRGPRSRVLRRRSRAALRPVRRRPGGGRRGARLASRGDVRRPNRARATVLARDPLREEAHGVLIAGVRPGGTRSQVVRQYRRRTARSSGRSWRSVRCPRPTPRTGPRSPRRSAGPASRLRRWPVQGPWTARLRSLTLAQSRPGLIRAGPTSRSTTNPVRGADGFWPALRSGRARRVRLRLRSVDADDRRVRQPDTPGRRRRSPGTSSRQRGRVNVRLDRAACAPIVAAVGSAR